MGSSTASARFRGLPCRCHRPQRRAPPAPLPLRLQPNPPHAKSRRILLLYPLGPGFGLDLTGLCAAGFGVKRELTAGWLTRVGVGVGGAHPVRAGHRPAHDSCPRVAEAPRSRAAVGRRLRREAPLSLEERPGTLAPPTPTLDGHDSRCGLVDLPRPRRPGRAGRPPAKSSSPQPACLAVFGRPDLPLSTPADGLPAWAGAGGA